MRNLRTPGIYLREVEVKPPPRLRMDIAGFVGQAERGPLNFPQPLTSWGEYRDIFGDFIGYGYVPYCVFSFFANGGEKCYVVRVAYESAAAKPEPAAMARLEAPLFSRQKDKDGKLIPLIQVQAINQGVWGNDIEVVAEEASSGDMILTELEDDLTAGSPMVHLKSVHGFLDAQTAGAGNGDQITIVNRNKPTQQGQATIKSINFQDRTVVFEKAVHEKEPFPAGSLVLGKGFKLIFRYLRNGQQIRRELFDNLSADPNHKRYFVRLINGDPEEPDYINRIRADNSILVQVTDLCKDRTKGCARIAAKTTRLSGGSDGDYAQVTAKYFTGYENSAYFRPPLSSDAEPEVVRKLPEKLLGLAAYEAVEEIGIVAIPDLIIPDFYAALAGSKIPEQGIIFAKLPKASLNLENLKAGQMGLLSHCQKMGERFALLDSPRGAEIGKGKNRIDEWPNNFQLLPSAKYGALYYPWVRQKAADFAGRELFIPPCGHMAGIYSRVEQARGVGKAPANETLQGAVEFEFCLSDGEQAILNPRGINCLRFFPGRGLRVWGARTFSLDSLSVYVNIRRVTLAIIKNILVRLRWTVFEPNDQRLWDQITSVLKTFFSDLFESGALAGATPAEAFFVKCNEETNPPEVVDLGQVITEIGFAPARPAEFILVTIKRTPGALSVIER